MASNAARAAALAASMDLLGLAKRRGREYFLFVALGMIDVEAKGRLEGGEEGVGMEKGRWKACERRGRDRVARAAVASKTRKEEEEKEEEETGRGLLLLLVLCADDAVDICACNRDVVNVCVCVLRSGLLYLAHTINTSNSLTESPAIQSHMGCMCEGGWAAMN